MNKKLISGLVISASILGGIAFNQTPVAAATANGVVTTVRLARLYNRDGKLITNRALAAKTPWITNQKTQLDHVGTVYRVATNEFVKADDVTFQHGQSKKGVINTGANGAVVYNYQNGNYVATSSKLNAYSRWQYIKVDSNNGKTWYQVGSNDWINSDDSSTAMIIKNTGIATISYAPASGIDLYQGYGSHKVATGQKLTNGTSWKFFQKVVDENGDAWYKIGKDQWISGYFTKITNTDFNQAAADIWDPNYAALKVTKNTAIYSDSKYNSATNKSLQSGTLVQVDSTVQEGNTIWYEISNGGWLPSTATTTVSATRAPIQLNGQTKSQVINDIIAIAKQQLGKPYVWNAKGPDSYDCSGLMQYVFRQATGQNIGSWTVPQEASGTKVAINQLQPGDLVFWGPQGASYHVALYLGNNKYLNALRPGTNVKIDSISSNFAPSFGVRVF